MRDVTVGGTSIQIRGLTRREVKTLKKEGFDLLTGTQPGQINDLIDRVFAMVLAEADIQILEDAPQHEALRVFGRIMSETFGAQDEVKNS